MSKGIEYNSIRDLTDIIFNKIQEFDSVSYSSVGESVHVSISIWYDLMQAQDERVMNYNGINSFTILGVKGIKNNGIDGIEVRGRR